MGTDLSIEAKRFRLVREQAGMTQAEFAQALGINNSTADIERGRTKISGKVVSQLLKRFEVNPLWLFGESHTKKLDLKGNTAPQVISMKTEDRENIIMVPVKASAGYAANVMDTDWYKELPAFDIPLPQYREGSYRAFQVQGDSMLPVLNPDEWVMGRAVESLGMANDNRIHVVVTPDSVLVKKIKKTERENTVLLVSLNRDYPTIEQPISGIRELWEVNSKLSFNVTPDEASDSIISLKQGLDSLRAEIAQMRSNS